MSWPIRFGRYSIALAFFELLERTKWHPYPVFNVNPRPTKPFFGMMVYHGGWLPPPLVQFLYRGFLFYFVLFFSSPEEMRALQ